MAEITDISEMVLDADEMDAISTQVIQLAGKVAERALKEYLATAWLSLEFARPPGTAYMSLPTALEGGGEVPGAMLRKPLQVEVCDDGIDRDRFPDQLENYKGWAAYLRDIAGKLDDAVAECEAEMRGDIPAGL